MPFCTNCGTQYEEGARFCTRCGSATTETAKENEEQTSTTLLENHGHGYIRNKGEDTMLNLREVNKLTQKMLKNEWGHIEFEQEFNHTDNGRKYLLIHANGKIKNHDDSVLLSAYCIENGVVSFFLVFDQIEKDKGTLTLLNKFNANSRYYRAYIDNDDYLTLEFNSCIQREDDFPFLLNEILNESADIADDEILQALTDLTE